MQNMQIPSFASILWNIVNIMKHVFHVISCKIISPIQTEFEQIHSCRKLFIAKNSYDFVRVRHIFYWLDDFNYQL